ncbi:hypothetical protein TNCV_2151911 [Trichonephila clavipes]|uniref:Uncharacterized protein n=1 Tax=Trichonephila clavipes TaxID=2585209 RepID=A0A8X6UXE3_TRICX|nr:hypothetical protein TNCV_2151911 [Trichonephila clavipes]
MMRRLSVRNPHSALICSHTESRASHDPIPGPLGYRGQSSPLKTHSVEGLKSLHVVLRNGVPAPYLPRPSTMDENATAGQSKTYPETSFNMILLRQKISNTSFDMSSPKTCRSSLIIPESREQRRPIDPSFLALYFRLKKKSPGVRFPFMSTLFTEH